MKRLVILYLLLLATAACQLPPERAVVIQPLPDNSGPIPYAELLTRARGLATQATEAFYINQWKELDEAAQALEQTGRFLGTAEEVPVGLKDVLPVASGDLIKEARKLRQAAQAKDEKAANDALQRINLKIREIRPPSK
jgi:hypothetical protein